MKDGSPVLHRQFEKQELYHPRITAISIEYFREYDHIDQKRISFELVDKAEQLPKSVVVQRQEHHELYPTVNAI